ncbi:hypothetical protein JOB18_033583 [Solea senegalensis]|uniref:Uncharacterized protein n=1 Tax=Solea senegalensis TaxID=28829 RepID=A0AAV6QGH3_SOLSE|nr:hypothetical protein JOB18_033583 [Solea senegalensis]
MQDTDEVTKEMGGVSVSERLTGHKLSLTHRSLHLYLVGGRRPPLVFTPRDEGDIAASHFLDVCGKSDPSPLHTEDLNGTKEDIHHCDRQRKSTSILDLTCVPSHTVFTPSPFRYNVLIPKRSHCTPWISPWGIEPQDSTVGKCRHPPKLGLASLAAGCYSRTLQRQRRRLAVTSHPRKAYTSLWTETDRKAMEDLRFLSKPVSVFVNYLNPPNVGLLFERKSTREDVGRSVHRNKRAALLTQHWT